MPKKRTPTKKKPVRRRPKSDNLGPPLNMSEDMADMSVIAAGTMKATPDNDGFGVFTIVTPVGYYTFMMGQESANDMIQALREFVAGDVASVVDDD
ncbi:hypothetical protein ACVWZK_006424 [Bradyrhizobium sp. GM0.4]